MTSNVIPLSYWVLVLDSVELWRGTARDSEQAIARSGLARVIGAHVAAGGDVEAGKEIMEDYINYVIAQMRPDGDILSLTVIYII